MSVPSIPPRPVRSQDLPSSLDAPRIPPRPTRRADRSVSPNRDTFARSPLNDAMFVGRTGRSGANVYHTTDMSVPQRPPSVTLPSIGQEGSEYAGLEDGSSDQDLPAETKNVAGDLPLHAPTASLPSAMAKSRINPLTRTDSSQAAAIGIGKAYTETADEKSPSHYDRSTSSLATSNRAESIQETDEQGIPEIGVQVPMYPNAGDVQAPTPAPSAVLGGPGAPPGNGAHRTLTHGRTKSREFFHGPPGSYGLHGHGILPKDPIERAWYERHPEALAQETQGEYGPAISEHRKEWALSSDDLNKLVHSIAQEAGETGDPIALGQPDEEIGYLASEEYTSRITSPRSPHMLQKQRTGSSQTHAESPLRNMSFPVNDLPAERLRSGSMHDQAGAAVESDDEVLHINPSRRASRVYEGLDDLTRTAVPEEDMPILAADELAKRPTYEFMAPAVPPELERLHNHEEPPTPLPGSRSPRMLPLRPNGARSASPGTPKFHEHGKSSTPLEGVKEYEPLFPDDENEMAKPRTAADKLKRPDLARHHFPSQDIWEDTPNSLQLHTTVEEPTVHEEPDKATKPSVTGVFEHPDAEANRKSALEAQNRVTGPSVPQRPAGQRPAKSHFKSDVMSDMGRPGMQQRFPSQDIWEDTPSHLQLVTTVETPEQSAGEHSPQEAGSMEKSTKPAKSISPNIPARPTRPKPKDDTATSPADRKVPHIPERPKTKPSIPPRPAKVKQRDSTEDVPLSKTTSGSSASAAPAESSPTSASSALPPAPKPKPAVPARPGGSKIAALKAGFMSDLNSRLQLGPQAVKQDEEKKKEEEETAAKAKEPLADARKGRARGPQRRKPGASPAAAATAAPKNEPPAASRIATPATVWEIGDEGAVVLGAGEPFAPGTAAKTAEVSPSAGVAETSQPETVEPDSGSLKPVSSADSGRNIGPESVPEPTTERDDPLSSVSVPTPPPVSAVEAEAEAEAATSPVAEAEGEPNRVEDAAEPTSPTTSDAAVQTGQTEIVARSPKGTEKFTVYVGGGAQGGETVVVKDDEDSAPDEVEETQEQGAADEVAQA